MKSIVFKSDITIEDSSLLKTGELRFVVNEPLRSITTDFVSALKIKIVNGTGNFTDSAGNIIGTELLPSKISTGYATTFYATEGSVVSIPNKYDLRTIICSGSARITIDFDDLKYSGITRMSLFGNPIGEFSALKNAANVVSLNLVGENFWGNLNVFSSATSITIGSPSDKVTLDLSNLPSTLTAISFSNESKGVVGNIEDATNVTSLWLQPCSVTGDIGNLNSNLTKLGLRGCTNVTGTFADIANYPSLTQISMDGTLITGNLGDISASTCPSLSMLRLPDGVTYTQAQKDAFLNAHQYLNNIEGGTLIE